MLTRAILILLLLLSSLPAPVRGARADAAGTACGSDGACCCAPVECPCHVDAPPADEPAPAPFAPARDSSSTIVAVALPPAIVVGEAFEVAAAYDARRPIVTPRRHAVDGLLQPVIGVWLT